MDRESPGRISSAVFLPHNEEAREAASPRLVRATKIKFSINNTNDHDDNNTRKSENNGEESNNSLLWGEVGSSGRKLKRSIAFACGRLEDQKDPLETGDTWGYLRHITISRDLTQAGASGKEILAVLHQDLGDSNRLVDEETRGSPRSRHSSPSGRKSAYSLRFFKEGRPPMLRQRQNFKQSGRKNPGTYAIPYNMRAETANDEYSQDHEPSNAVRIAQLEEEIQELRRQQSSLQSTTWQILHKVEDDESSYLIEPCWAMDDGHQLRLRGNMPLADEAGYLAQRLDIAFVVYKHYKHDYQTKAIEKAKIEGSTLPDPAPAKETIQLLSEQMISAVDIFFNSQPRFKDYFPDWSFKIPFQSPFLFWYHFRLDEGIEAMPEPHRTQMRLLTDWIEQNYNDIYSDAETEFAHGKVSRSTMPFFVRPGEVVVSKSDKGIEGYIAKSWATEDIHRCPSQPSWADEPHNTSSSWTVKAWSYRYDGRFYEHNTALSIDLEFDEDHHNVDISKLSVLPLRFGDGEFDAQLVHRGRVMWACREKKLIAYKHGPDNALAGGERYMVDFDTYKQLHSDSPKFKEAFPFLNKRDRKEMKTAMMECEDPPQGPELMVFPSKVIGYNLRQKKWRDLEVDLIQDVSWNKQAFLHLVIKDEIKDLIQALVSSKLGSEENTDLIQGKGNGLIMLLHGGPGTGKTFTAESVAELAEKPLFCVTCGDIGTRPDEVEKYLESVLHLGKIWGCVVLLDEADVFLEQRTLQDLERNALVSVFLRVLEYYEGILFLTSNRVGTFDEAFKSRIQLSLHYEALDKSQRRTIWSNFMNRLKTLERDHVKIEPIEKRKRKFEEPRGIDFDDIGRHLGDLAEHEMNGRQIRNALTTARQLAKFKEDSMTYRHLEHVISISSEFDLYLQKPSRLTQELRNSMNSARHMEELHTGRFSQRHKPTGGTNSDSRIPCDVSDKQAIQDLTTYISQRENRLDILVSNAGIRRDPPVRCNVLTASLSELQASMWSSRHSDWADTFCVNTTSHYFLSVAFLPLLEAASRAGRDEGRGVVIMTSSCASMHNATNIDLTSYATSKAATDHLVKLLAAKFSRFYVRVVGINPGFVPSNMNPVGEEGNLFSALFDQVPAKRAGNESDIAGTVLYLASRAGAYVDGISLCVDGGRVLLANGQE
ncbi:hypothetical protein NM208_g5192 [Fusarium decemcellulare]|uniref:Uncharacterized protein n=1 Tax=Fusarium decemcellulare TaxID=57161 RepID=A0ACC1SHS6_9HYPO|nr:hypothetical protein NM208_g5192 [Fusarium decemcellulare]